MNFRMTLLASSLALIASGPSMAATLATPLMSQDFVISTPQQVSNLLDQLSAKHGLSADFGLAIKTEHPGTFGTKVARVNHFFHGIRIYNSQSVVIANSSGTILSESIADLRLGLGGKGTQLDLIPALSDAEVINKVITELAPNGSENIVNPSAELVIFPVMKTLRTAAAANKAETELNALDLQRVVDGHVLAYVVETRMIVDGRQQLFTSIVNAQNGQLITRINKMHTVIGTGKSQYNGNVPINTTFANGVYSMIDASRGVGGTFGAMAITNANHSGSNAGLVYTNDSNIWGDGLQYVEGGSTTGANGQTAAVNALWGLMNTYDTMNNTMGWKSLDGQNTATYIAVHANAAYDNAFYSDACKCMFIGDGSFFTNLGSIDVIGHEMGHGVTAATSDLIYAGESGGLNESNSDINGEMVEAYARAGGTGTTIPGGNDFFVGKEIAKNGVPLRFMQKPSKDGRSPDAWSSSIGGIDVHYSSGPNNRMFYFLSQGSNATIGNDAYTSFLKRQPAAMTGIGNDKAYRIWFKANTTKFTPSTDYADARAKVIESAEELYGVGSAEAIAVKRAYAAINVGPDADEIGFSSPVFVVSQPNNFAVTVGGTATFTVAADAGKAPYSYVWYKNGKKVGTGATYSFVTTSADNGAKIFARITDSSATPGTAASATAILTVNPLGTLYERLINGSFEQGAVAWAGNTGDISNWGTGQPAFDGTKNAWMGGNAAAITENLYQTVTLPANATKATLKFALHIDTAEAGATTAIDTFKVTIRDTNNAILKTLGVYSNLDFITGYQVRTFDVSEFKGQTVRVHFTETENASKQTSFSVDAVSLVTD